MIYHKYIYIFSFAVFFCLNDQFEWCGLLIIIYLLLEDLELFLNIFIKIYLLTDLFSLDIDRKMS